LYCIVTDSPSTAKSTATATTTTSLPTKDCDACRTDCRTSSYTRDLL